MNDCRWFLLGLASRVQQVVVRWPRRQVAHCADGDEVVDGLSLKKVTEYEGEGWYLWKEDGIWHTDYYDLSTLLPAIWSGEWWKILE